MREEEKMGRGRGDSNHKLENCQTKASEEGNKGEWRVLGSQFHPNKGRNKIGKGNTSIIYQTRGKSD